MQGYILHTHKVRDEDLLVKIITTNHLYTLYRFYGARHSTIHIGHKIDFIIERDIKNLGKLREPSHLSFDWEIHSHKRYYWQQYITLLNTHLQDVSNIDNFYFDHLEHGAIRLNKEEPKRCMLSLYAKLLNFEGRNNPLNTCLICNNILNDDKIIILRGILAAHKECINGTLFNKSKILHWLNGNGEFLEDNEVDKLWEVLLLGI